MAAALILSQRLWIYFFLLPVDDARSVWLFVKCRTKSTRREKKIYMYTKRQQALWLSSTESVQTRLVNYVWNVTAATAAAVVAKTTMLINSFPHPAVTGSDLAATLTENKTINVTCRSKSANIHTHTHTHTHCKAHNIGIYYYICTIYTRLPRIDLYIDLYAAAALWLLWRQIVSYEAHTTNTIRNRRRRPDKLLLYFPCVGVLYGMYVFVTSRALFSAGDIIIICR